MSFTMPTIEDGGCHYEYTDHLGNAHHICATLSIDPGWETLVVLATENGGECLALAAIDYFNPGDWQAEVDAAGGLGSWWMSKRDWINGAVSKHFIDHPMFPQLTNSSPITYENARIVGETYFHFAPPVGEHSPPVFEFQPFQQP